MLARVIVLLTDVSVFVLIGLDVIGFVCIVFDVVVCVMSLVIVDDSPVDAADVCVPVAASVSLVD